MKKIWVYKITNPNWNIYIWQSTDIDRRLSQYVWKNCKDQPKLFNSIQKYWFINHKFEILALCEISELNDLERFYIEKYSSNSNEWLNLTSWWQNYFTHSDEVRTKMSMAQMWNKKTLWRKQSKEEIEKRVKKLRWKKRTEEFRLRMSLLKKWTKLSEDTKKKLSASLKYKNAKRIVCTKTWKIFNRCEDAANEFWIKKTTLIAMLNWQNRNRTTLIYI